MVNNKGLIHGNEAIGVNMCIYIINKLIYGYVNKDPTYTYLLENRRIWFIPIINVDTYLYIQKQYSTTNNIILLKKNQRSDNFTNGNACGQFPYKTVRND